jgi:molecular chaperone HscA
MEALTAARNGKDHHAIAKQIEELTKATDGFAAKRMNDNMKRALAGQVVDTW